LRARLYVVLRSRADGREVLAVVVLFEAVLQTVSAITSCAMYTLRAGGIDQCLARRVGTLLVVVEDGRFWGRQR